MNGYENYGIFIQWNIIVLKTERDPSLFNNTEDISEMIWSQKDRYCMIPFI